MVTTPVGYKCRECARPAAGQLRTARPRQLLLSAAAAFGAALVGGLVLGQIHIGFFFVALIFGALVGEAARRGSGGHRVPAVAAVAGMSALVGAFVAGFSLIGLVLCVVAAAFTVLGGR
jgi:hypothetical protein